MQTTPPLFERLSGRTPLEATYRISTPLFLGGFHSNDRHCADTLSPPSVKGALRFWWRALNWARIYLACQKNRNNALRQLHREEAALFGQAAREQEGQPVGGQAAFRLRIKHDGSSRIKKLPIEGTKIGYLLGQGLKSDKNNGDSYLEQGQAYTVVCYPGARLCPEQKEQLAQVLLCLGLLGGLGARARKGLGSLSILRLEGSAQFHAPTNREEYSHMLRALLSQSSEVTDSPPFSAFSALTRVDIGAHRKPAKDNTLTLLQEYNERLQQYRTWQKPEHEKPLFPDDHDWAYDVAQGRKPGGLPRRVVFGLPHNYYLSKIKKNVGINADTGRRSSPLLAHVHQFENGESLLTLCLLHADFLHKSTPVKITLGKRENGRQPGKVDWQVITGFMDTFEERTSVYGQ